MRTTVARAATCLSVFALAHAAESAAQGAQEVTGPGGQRVEEIIVTAQKREQTLQDVPTSMAVLTAAKLEEIGMVQLTDYAKVTPGLTIIGGGGPGQGQPVIRGISSGNDRNALVGLYLDEVPFTTSSPRFQGVQFSFDPALADIERIEVLKGPQSTLYGASTMGGLVKFVSRKPSLTDLEGSVFVSGSHVDGHGDGYSARLSTNVPLVTDKVGLRGSIFYRKDPGYVGDSVRNEKDANSGDAKGGRITLLIKPGDRLETSFTGFLQKMTGDGSYAGLLDGETLEPPEGEFAYPLAVKSTYAFEYRLFDNTTTLELPFATLTNIISYADFSVDLVEDLSAAVRSVGAPSAISTQHRSSKRYSDEIRLASLPGKIEWLLGGFFTREKVSFPSNIRGADANGVRLPTTSPVFEIDNYHTTGKYRERAAFGNITYHFTDRLEATAGVRYTANEQEFTTRAHGLIRFIDDDGLTINDSQTSYLATISYKPTADLTVYLRAASAYRPGGPNSLLPAAIEAGTPLSYRADTLWNYEAGLKGTAWGGLLTYSAAAYYMDWEDIQAQVLYTVPGSSVVFGYTGNASKAKSEGVEFDLQLTPWGWLQGLTVGLAGSYNEATLIDPTGLPAAKGDSLPYTPKWTWSALVDYEASLSNAVRGTVGLTYAYTDERFSSFQFRDPFALDAYNTLDLRLGLKWAQYSLVARVDNLTDEYAVTSMVAPSRTSPPPLLGRILRPRTFGVSFEAKF